MVDGDLGAYLDWLDGHGVRFALAPDLARRPDHDGPLVVGDDVTRAVELPGVAPFVEHRDPERGLAADHATLCLADALLVGGYVPLGCRFWDIGCGTGVLAVAAALAGARGVVASDIDERALALARRTAADANVAVRFCEGPLLDPVPPRITADVVAANLPHKPSAPGAGLPIGQAGGPDGDAVHGAFAAAAAARLQAGARVFFFLHSLPHPRLLLRYAEAFDLSLLTWKRRFLGPGEFGALERGFRDRAAAGVAWIGNEGERSFLLAGVWQAVRR